MRLQAAAFGKAATDMINNMLENRKMSDYEPIDDIAICRILYNANRSVELGLQLRKQTKLIGRLANKEGLQQFSEKFGEVRMFLENQEMPSSIS